MKPHNRQLTALGTLKTSKLNLDDNKAAAILNFTLQPDQPQPSKKKPLPLQKKKTRAESKPSAPHTTVYTLRRQPETLATMESTPTASALSPRKATGDNGKAEQLADKEQLPKKKGQSQGAKRRISKKRVDALKAAATFGGNLQNLVTASPESVVFSDPEPSASAATAIANLVRAYQAQVEDDPEDDPEDGSFQKITTESEDIFESEAFGPHDDDDNDNGVCTCDCKPRKLYVNGDEIETYDPKLMADFIAKNPQLSTLIAAAKLKLRADHLHNIWFGCVAAIRKCGCEPCSTPYSPCYEWVARPAKEEYWAADKKLDDFLEQKKAQLTKEVVAIMEPGGRTEEAKATFYLRNRSLANGLIKSLLPDGRDKEVELRGKGKIPVLPVILDLNI